MGYLEYGELKMAREIREVIDNFGTKKYIIYCNTIDQYITTFDFEDEDTAEVFLEAWHSFSGFDPKFQGTATFNDVHNMIKEYRNRIKEGKK